MNASDSVRGVFLFGALYIGGLILFGLTVPFARDVLLAAIVLAGLSYVTQALTTMILHSRERDIPIPKTAPRLSLYLWLATIAWALFALWLALRHGW